MEHSPSPPDQHPGWPAIPSSIRGLAGRILIRQPWRVDSQCEPIVGLWESRERVIKIDRRLSRHVKWQILAHEFVHAAISDAGIVLDEVMEERLCDAIGSALATAFDHHLEKTSANG